MEDEEETTPTGIEEELFLTEKDFPVNFVNMQHPEDYSLQSTPIVKELIYHHRKGLHTRLILRVSIKLAEGIFTPISFVLDTGAPKVYTSSIAENILTKYGIHKYRVESTPENYAPQTSLD